LTNRSGFYKSLRFFIFLYEVSKPSTFNHLKQGLMAKSVVIFLEDMVEDAEFLYPYLRFQEAGFEVTAVAPQDKIYTGKRGMPFTPDQLFEEVKGETFDAVFIPGGYAPDRLRRDDDILEFVKRHNEAEKLIGAVCHAGWVLISAEIVEGRTLTGYHAIKDDLLNAGANYTGKDVERDGNLITATNPQTMLPMMQKMVSALKGAPVTGWE
jgi:protease I